jgi:uncharacterized lipoprotein YmbA
MTSFLRAAPLALLLTASCSSPEPNYYTLDVIPGTSVSVAPHVIEVRRPGLAGYLDRAEIVGKAADYRLNLDPGTRWAEPLGDMIGRVFAQDLAQRLPSSTVYAEGGAVGADPGLRVALDVQRFDDGGDGLVHLTGVATLEQGRGHVLLDTQHIDLQAHRSSGRPAELAAAMSQLLGEAADQVAAGVRKKGLLF